MKKFMVIIITVAAAILLQACSYSTANLSDVKVCTDADSNGNCSTDDSSFKTSDGDIYLSANLENAPDGTKVTATWSYVGGNPNLQPQDIDSVTAEAKDGGSMPFYSSLSAPTHGWPSGDYKVTLTLSSDNSTPIEKQFSIR